MNEFSLSVHAHLALSEKHKFKVLLAICLNTQAFQELQAKVIDTTQRVRIAEAQVDALRRTIMHAKLTDQEVASLPPDTKTYESLGRM